MQYISLLDFEFKAVNGFAYAWDILLHLDPSYERLCILLTDDGICSVQSHLYLATNIAVSVDTPHELWPVFLLLDINTQ